MTDWNSKNAGIEYEATGELIEDNVGVTDLPKHSDGDNVALQTQNSQLCWTEDLGANIINLDGYFDPDFSFGYSEIELDEDRFFYPDEITMELILPLDELIEAAVLRAAEDNSNVAYILGGWAYQAKKADHVSESSARKIRTAFEKVTMENEFETPEDANPNSYYGGQGE